MFEAAGPLEAGLGVLDGVVDGEVADSDSSAGDVDCIGTTVSGA